MKCEHPDSACANMTLYKGEVYCDSIPCSMQGKSKKQPQKRKEIIYCKDCKRWHGALAKTPDGHQADWGMCELMIDDVDTDETDFCSLGERRE